MEGERDDFFNDRADEWRALHHNANYTTFTAYAAVLDETTDKLWDDQTLACEVLLEALNEVVGKGSDGGASCENYTALCATLTETAAPNVEKHTYDTRAAAEERAKEVAKKGLTLDEDELVLLDLQVLERTVPPHQLLHRHTTRKPPRHLATSPPFQPTNPPTHQDRKSVV